MLKSFGLQVPAAQPGPESGSPEACVGGLVGCDSCCMLMVQGNRVEPC